MHIPFYHVDSFSTTPFRGNPAGVCLLENEIDPSLMQSIAAEMKVSETAFVVPLEQPDHFSLRWFTPTTEVALCGHATLATGGILSLSNRLQGNTAFFHTHSGQLQTRQVTEGIQMDFPCNPPRPFAFPLEAFPFLPLPPLPAAFYSPTLGKILLEVQDEQAVRSLQPNFQALLSQQWPEEVKGIIVTAKGTGNIDFVSRFFAPWLGVDEDPVTGSTHTILAPYWAHKTGKSTFHARQLSKREGELFVALQSERVLITGNFHVVLEGTLFV